MSVFGKIFGGGRKQQAPSATPQESIQKLRETEEMLVKKQEFLEKKIEAVSFPALFWKFMFVFSFFFHKRLLARFTNGTAYEN